MTAPAAVSLNRDQGTYDPFDAIPQIIDGVRFWRNRDNLVQIQVDIQERKKLAKLLADRFGLKKSVRICLDERGSGFFELIDGKRTLHAIERAVRKEWGIEERESKDAVVKYTAELMRRGLVGLRLPPTHPMAKSGEHGG